MPSDKIPEAAFRVLSVAHGFEWGWIDDMGDRDDPDAYVPLWRCTATGNRDTSCLGCDSWEDLGKGLGIMPPKPTRNGNQTTETK